MSDDAKDYQEYLAEKRAERAERDKKFDELRARIYGNGEDRTPTEPLSTDEAEPVARDDSSPEPVTEVEAKETPIEVKESPAELERQKILTGDHWYATMAEIEALTPEQYARWAQAGHHLKEEQKPEPKPAHSQEEMDAISKMPIPEFRQWKIEYEKKRRAELDE